MKIYSNLIKEHSKNQLLSDVLINVTVHAQTNDAKKVI